MTNNVMPFERKSQGQPPAPTEQTVKVSFIGKTSQENFFSILNVGVDPYTEGGLGWLRKKGKSS